MKKYKIEIVTHNIFNDSIVYDCVICAMDKIEAYAHANILAQMQAGAMLQICEIL